MFYKLRNILLAMMSCLLAFSVHEAKTQGLVSLSEEAMFDDELESDRDFPAISRESSAEVGVVPQSAPKAPVIDKIVNKEDASAQKNEEKVIASQSEKASDNKVNVFAAPVVANYSNSVKDEKSKIEDLGQIKGDLFSQMSDIEKRTALLNLELRREKLQNEIEAVKSQRRQALIAEEEKIEAARLKNIEFEKEQERKVLVEQEKLRELDIEFEALRQESILSEYKNKMLEEHQKWIDHNKVFYDQIANLRDSERKLVENIQSKVKELKTEAQRAKELYNSKVEGYKKENKDLHAQVGVLRKRVENLEKERDELASNPFAGGALNTSTGATPSMGAQDAGDGIVAEPIENDLSKLYAVTEIRGQGGEMVAKLINKNGTAFYVKKGTALQSGHTIDEISSTYVAAEKNGDKKYLYFAAGGVLPAETSDFELE